jgi:acyl-CoA thioesterase FadM
MFRYLECARLEHFAQLRKFAAQTDVGKDAHDRFMHSLAYSRSGAKEAAVGPILKSTNCTFREQTNFPDTLLIGSTVSNVSRRGDPVVAKNGSKPTPEGLPGGVDRFTMEYVAVSCGTGRVVSAGEAVMVVFDYAGNRKASLPEELVDAMDAVEAHGLVLTDAMRAAIAETDSVD